MKKKVCSFGIFFLAVISLFGAMKKDKIGDYQKAYRNALYSFDSVEYGKALKYAEDAILFRKQQIEYEVETLKNSLASKAVQAAGESITDILKVLEKRRETESINIIRRYLNKKGVAFFDNSISNLMEYMSSLSVFPEAQKLIGDIYKLEGEYNFAEQYYLMALENASVLDIPNEKYEILYMLAEISKFEEDYESYEVRLLNILAEDDKYKSSALGDAILNTIKGNSGKSVDKLFSLYRADSYMSLNAYIQLSQYYFDINELEKALKLSALAVITSFTKITESLESRDLEYSSSTLEKFLQECSLYDDIIQWGDDNKVWSSFTSFAKIAIANGYNEFAKELLQILVKYLPEPYWQQDAVITLGKIN